MKRLAVLLLTAVLSMESVIGSVVVANAAYTEDEIIESVTVSGNDGDITVYAEGEEAEGVELNTTNFPDERFLKLVSNYDSDNDGILSQEEIDAVTEIGFARVSSDSRNPLNVTGIKIFHNVETLVFFLAYVDLSTLDFSWFPELKNINLITGNDLVLNLTNNKKLEKLSVMGNVKSIDITGLDRLKELDLGSSSYIEDIKLDENNSIEKFRLICVFDRFDFSKMKELKELTFLGKLKTIDLSENTKLQKLDLHYNRLEEINLSNNKYLTEVNLENNALKSLSIESEYLKDLKVANNMLEELSIASGELEELGASNNKLTDINLSKQKILTNLYLSDNELNELNVSENVYLQKLFCINNNIETLDLTNNAYLETLNCENNNISGIDISETNLYYGSSNQNIGNIHKFFQQKDEKTCSVSMNSTQKQICINENPDKEEYISVNGEEKVVALDEFNFPDPVFRQYVMDKFDIDKDGYLSCIEISQVERIFISDTKIETLKGIENFPYLWDLDIIRCGLKEIDLSGNKNLLYLNIAENDITELDVSMLKKLYSFVCYQNKLKELNLGGLHRLETLSCNENEIEYLNISDMLRPFFNDDLSNIRYSRQNTDNDMEVEYSDFQKEYLENIGFFDNNPNVKPAVHRHMSFNTGWMTDSKSHWKVCDIDKEKYEFAEHTFVEHKTDKTKLICNVCGFTIAKPDAPDVPSKPDDTLTTHEHKLTVYNEVAATCTEPGIKAYYSCECGEMFSDAEGKNAIADLDAWKKAEGAIIAKGHEWDDGVISKKPTYFEKGLGKYTCKNCAASDIKDVEKKDAIDIAVKSKYDMSQVVAIVLKDSQYKDAKISKYTVSSKKIASVSKKGKLTTKKAGALYVTAYSKGEDGKAFELCKIKFNIMDTRLEKKAKITAANQVLDMNTLLKDVPEDATVTWSMSSKSAKKVDFDQNAGTIKAIKNCKVTVKCIIKQGNSEIKKSCVVTVKLPK